MMFDLGSLHKHTRVLVQGITGKEGQRVTGFMLASGVQVVAGVRPGKGGDTVLGVPVYDTVADAIRAQGDIDVSCVYTPPLTVLRAATEAMEAGIRLFHCIGEGIPIKDTAMMLETARSHRATILGPASLGMIKPGIFKIGSIGGDDNSSFTPGSVGVVSRSGGMSSELSHLLSRAGIGQSAVIHVGGDFLIGIRPVDALLALEADPQTKSLLLIAEVGGGYELEVAEAITQGRLTKPLTVFLAGAFVETLPQQVPLGHAGAIIQSSSQTRSGKAAMFEALGVSVASNPQQILTMVTP